MIRNRVMEIMGRNKIKTGRELSQLTGVAESNVYRIINGESKGLQFSTLNALCRVLKCQTNELFEYVPDAEQSELPL